jgi:hypothetical protein
MILKITIGRLTGRSFGFLVVFGCCGAGVLIPYRRGALERPSTRRRGYCAQQSAAQARFAMTVKTQVHSIT